MKPTAYVVALLILVGCSSQQGEKQEIKNNGVEINYTLSGSGERTLLFVHGWCINQKYWDSQVAFFNKNYKVVTIDLPGHGNSGKQRDSWKVSDYASDVVKVIDELKLKHVVLIGHSMGGDIVLEAALARPEVVDAIIGVDNFKDVGVLPDEQTRQAISQFFDMLEADYSNTVASYANEYLFGSETDSVTKARVVQDYKNADSKIATETLRELFDYSTYELERLSSLHKPFRLVNSDLPPTDTIAFTKNNIDYRVYYIKGTGHFPMVEKPNDFNEALKKALDDLK